jgi:hypothetical protein
MPTADQPIPHIDRQYARELLEGIDKVISAADQLEITREELEGEVENDIQYAISAFTSQIFWAAEGLHTFLHRVHHAPDFPDICAESPNALKVRLADDPPSS